MPMNKSYRYRRIVSSILGSGLTVAIAAISTSAIAADYKAPFNVSVQRETHGLLDLTRKCATPPAPIVELVFTDAEAAKQTRKLLFRYQRKLNEITDAYVRSKPANQLLAQCANDWLTLWASNGALLGKADTAGAFIRKKLVASIALAHLKLTPGALSQPVEQDIVRQWLNDLGHLIREEYSNESEASSRRNFNLYEAAMSVTAAGIATGDSELFDWGIDQTRTALSLIPDDGWFPWALFREEAALKLQLRSVGPLVVTAEIAAANGINLYDVENGALHRLVSTAMEGYQDPTLFSKRLGMLQTGIADLNPQTIAWLTIYGSRFPEVLANSRLRKDPAIKSQILGGDLKLLYTDEKGQRAHVDSLTAKAPTDETSQK